MDYSAGYSRCWSRRGFRLHRLSVKTVRVRFMFLARLLRRTVRALRRRSRFSSSSSSRMPLVKEKNYERSNSFYSEAIRDCLEFIKRNSVSGLLADEQSQLLDLEEDQVRVRVRFPTECNRPRIDHEPFRDDISSNTALLSKVV